MGIPNCRYLGVALCTLVLFICFVIQTTEMGHGYDSLNIATTLRVSPEYLVASITSEGKEICCRDNKNLRLGY